MRSRIFVQLWLVCAVAGCAAGGASDPGSGHTGAPAGSEQVVNAAEITAAFVGRTAVFDRGAEATYAPNGDYHIAGFGRTSSGRYTISDGQICVVFSQSGAASRTRCDRITKLGDTYRLTDADNRTYSIQFR